MAMLALATNLGEEASSWLSYHLASRSVTPACTCF